MEINIEKIIEKRIDEFIESEIKDMLKHPAAYGTRDIANIIIDKIAVRFVFENYEEIIQKLDKDQIAEYVRQRAILLAARRMDEGK